MERIGKERGERGRGGKRPDSNLHGARIRAVSRSDKPGAVQMLTHIHGNNASMDDIDQQPPPVAAAPISLCAQ